MKLFKSQYDLDQVRRESRLLLSTSLVEKVVTKQSKLCFCKIVKNEVSLMVGIHVDDIIVSRVKGMCDEFFHQMR